MRNTMLSDGMAEARADGRKRITRRLNTPLLAGDVVYHGEALVPLTLDISMGAITHVATYRRDGARILFPGKPGLGFQAWVWRVNVMAARYCPERCARLFSLVRSVRQEPLQDITEDQARAEGVTVDPQQGTVNGEPATLYPMTCRQAFIWLRDTLHNRPGERWADNPTVFVVDLGENLTREEATRLAAIKDRAARLAEARAA